MHLAVLASLSIHDISDAWVVEPLRRTGIGLRVSERERRILRIVSKPLATVIYKVLPYEAACEALAVRLRVRLPRRGAIIKNYYSKNAKNSSVSIDITVKIKNRYVVVLKHENDSFTPKCGESCL